MPQGTERSKLTGELLFLLAGLAALGAFATNIILPAFPAIGSDLGTSVKDLSTTLGTFFFTFAIGQLFVGPLSDRFGRRPLILCGLVIFVAGSAVCAMASGLPQLVVGRVVQALGVCTTSVLSRAIARDLFDGEALARTLSLIMIAMAAAPGFSPLLGGAISGFLGWRATFAAVGVAAVALGLLYVLRLGETHRSDRRIAVSLSGVAVTYGALLRDRRFASPALAVSLVIGSLYAFFAMAPALLMEGLGFSPFDLALFFAATVFVVFAAGFTAPWLARRWGAASAAIAGVTVALLGGIALLIGEQDVVYFSAALTVFLFGMGVVNPLGTAIALQPFGHVAGSASALLGFLQMGCAATAIGLSSSLALDPYLSFCAVLVSSLSLSLLALLSGGVRPQVTPLN